MFVKIGSTIYEAIKIYKSSNGYTFRISKDISSSFAESLSNTDTLTVQEGNTSYVVPSYEIGVAVEWANFIDYSIRFTEDVTIITKADLDNLTEQITNLELALCELFESQEG